LTSFQEAVLRWSQAGDGWRDLPWRRTRDPWAVLVSEVMLQQTQVSRVVPRWQVFLARFPDPASCAAAPVGEVIGLWVGLGYNRRAVQLHRAAAEIVDRHGGQLPATLDELRRLPGLVPYTARAVLVFAFEQPAAVVDTNVARVLARAVAGRRMTASEAQAAADDQVRAAVGEPAAEAPAVVGPAGPAAVPAAGAGAVAGSWRWNQAMLDLGARHCTALRPSCVGCPLRAGHCAWARAGFPEPDPAQGSAGVSGRQSAFAGSNRQGRGRVVRALQAGALPLGDVAAAAGWPDQAARAAQVAASLVADGLAVQVGDTLRLP
jgi:A/G-specific adenine glycosylase